MLVKDLMKPPHVIEKDVDLAQAAKLMSKKDIGSLILVSRNRAKGIMTEGDLVRNFGKQKKISSIMSKNMISIGPEETVDSAVSMMRENRIKRLPVVDKNKQLVGIISMMHIAAVSSELEGEFFFN